MKRRIAAFLAASFMLCGCSDNVDDSAVTEANDDLADFLTYEEHGSIGSFAVEDGKVYAFAPIYDDDGAVTEHILYCLDENGSAEELRHMESAPAVFDISDGTMYGTDYDNGSYVLSQYDIETDENGVICELSGFMQFNKLTVYEDTAWILGIHEDRTGIQGEYSDKLGTYSYNGEVLISVDLKTGEITQSAVDFPIAFSVFEGECAVYTADENGYYFTDFEDEKHLAHNIEMLYNFELYEPERFVFTAGSGLNLGKIMAGTVRLEDGTSDVINNVYAMNGLYVQDGFTYFRKASDTLGGEEQICRFRNSEYIKKNNKIRFISQEYSFDAPFGCGYTIEHISMSDDSFALSILSQDSSFDMCVVNSYDTVAGNIRDKGSFYPLNDIPEVQEYLNSCFPYLKEAATDSNGEIWMLPVSITVPAILFSEKNCASAGVKFTDGMTVQQLVEQCERAHSSDYNNGYGIHPYTLTQNWMIQYLTHSDSVDTEVFRSFSEYTREKLNMSDMTSYPEYMHIVNQAQNMLYFEGGEELFLFSYSTELPEQAWLAGLEGFSACAIPRMDGGDVNTATCAFITVNPASENLEATLDYVASLAEHLSQQQDSFMLSDKKMYSAGNTALYDIYANAEVGFNVSDELIYDSYVRYHAGELSLDEFITEAQRKYSAYLNE